LAFFQVLIISHRLAPFRDDDRHGDQEGTGQDWEEDVWWQFGKERTQDAEAIHYQEPKNDCYQTHEKR